MKCFEPCVYQSPGEAQLRHALAFIVVIILTAIPQIVLAAPEKTFHYTALTQERIAKPVRVVASGIEWQCSGIKCTTSGPWPVPGVLACRALAQKVGRIKAYGHAVARLSTPQLEQCNGSAAAKTTPDFDKPINDATRNRVPPISPKVLTPGPISGPEPGSLPSTPTAVLEDSQSGGILRTSQENWRCDGTRCTISRYDRPSSARHVIETCSRLAQTAGRVVWFTDGRAPFDADKLARCNSPVVHEIEVYACSGTDNLRDASHLKIGLFVKGRNFTDANYRRIMSAGIPSNSCQSARLGGILLTKFRLSELGAIYLYFHSYDSALFQSDDNWDMSRFSVIATVTEPGGRRLTERIVDERDNPIHRFASRGYWHVDVNP